MTEYIAFYGTLQSSHSTPVHEIINQSLQFVSGCKIQGQLFSKRRYPVLKEGGGIVKGELYKIHDAEALPKLDQYEATDNENPDLPGFTRKMVTLVEPQLRSWVYVYDGPVKQNELIASGRWEAR